MGFSVIAAQIMLITLFMVAIMLFATTMNNQAIQYANAKDEQSIRMANKQNANIIITSATYNTTTNITEIILLNNGSTSFSRESINIYFEQTRVSQKNENLIIVFDTDLGNPNWVDQKDVLRIYYPINLTPGTYNITITTPQGASDSSAFTV